MYQFWQIPVTSSREIHVTTLTDPTICNSRLTFVKAAWFKLCNYKFNTNKSLWVQQSSLPNIAKGTTDPKFWQIHVTTSREIHVTTLTNPTIWAKFKTRSEWLSDKARQWSDVGPTKIQENNNCYPQRGFRQAYFFSVSQNTTCEISSSIPLLRAS